MSFPSTLATTYNTDTKLTYKKLLDINTKLTTAQNTRHFLLRCRTNQVCPKHIVQHVKNLDNLFIGQHPFGKQVQKTLNALKKNILSIEIRISCWKIQQLETEHTKYLSKLQNTISFIHFNFVRATLSRQSIFLTSKLKIKLKRKFNTLTTPDNNNFIPPDDWFMNLSSTNIPTEVMNLLSLGPKYATPILTKQVPTFKLIADIEYAINSLDDEPVKNEVRSRTVNIISNYFNKVKNLKLKNNYICTQYRNAEKWLKDNKNISIIRADKTNKTVAIETTSYKAKMLELLSDRKTYVPIKFDSTNKIQTKNNKLVKNLFEKNYINSDLRKQLTIYNANTPRMYGLIKLHKAGFPIRPICSAINGPTSRIAKYLQKTLSNLENEDYLVKNSFEFINLLKI